ncbi:hypothetical protein RJZ57_001810 [Blastomyces gilchristii]
MDNNTTQAEAEKQQSEPEQKPPFKNFWRILGHGTLLDKILMGIATLCAARAGTILTVIEALPLMNIVFGLYSGIERATDR